MRLGGKGVLDLDIQVLFVEVPLATIDRNSEMIVVQGERELIVDGLSLNKTYLFDIY